MINHKKTCPMCGKEFEYYDIRKVPNTCGDRMCETNWTYRLKHADPITGKMPSSDDIKTWKK